MQRNESKFILAISAQRRSRCVETVLAVSVRRRFILLRTSISATRRQSRRAARLRARCSLRAPGRYLRWTTRKASRPRAPLLPQLRARRSETKDKMQQLCAWRLLLLLLLLALLRLDRRGVCRRASRASERRRRRPRSPTVRAVSRRRLWLEKRPSLPSTVLAVLWRDRCPVVARRRRRRSRCRSRRRRALLPAARATRRLTCCAAAAPLSSSR